MANGQKSGQSLDSDRSSINAISVCGPGRRCVHPVVPGAAYRLGDAHRWRRCAIRSLKFILLLSAIWALGRATIGMAEDQKPVTILRGTSAPPPPPSPPDPPPVGYENYGYTAGYDIPDYLPYYFLSAPQRFARHPSRFPS